MSDEKVQILPSFGPWAGQIISVPAADAKQAMSDGWARDPYAPPDPEKDAEPLDEKKRGKALDAAEAYARKLRGEDEPATETATTKRTSTASESGGDEASYTTRRSKAKE